MLSVGLLVEGDVDAAVGRRVIECCGGAHSTTYGRRGITYIREKIQGFNGAAAGGPILVLADLRDTGAPCAPEVRRTGVRDPHSNLIFRLVEREIESWLLADPVGIAKFLGVRRELVPHNPDSIQYPKRELVRLASRSHDRSMIRALVPEPGAAVVSGPGYSPAMVRFAEEVWDVDRAQTVSPSLARAMAALQFCLRGQCQ